MLNLVTSETQSKIQINRFLNLAMKTFDKIVLNLSNAHINDENNDFLKAIKDSGSIKMIQSLVEDGADINIVKNSKSIEIRKWSSKWIENNQHKIKNNKNKI